MTATVLLPGIISLGPQMILGSGVVLAMFFGMLRLAAKFPRWLPIAILLSAAAMAASLAATLTPPAVTIAALPPLIRINGMSQAWQFLFFGGALFLACSMEMDDEIAVVLLLGSVLGMTLLACADHLFMLFIGLEFMSLPVYLLVARGWGRRPKAREAAVKYFFAGGLAGALFLMGMALFYAETKTLALSGVSGVPLAEAGIALMGVSALFKIGAVPMHFWLPDVYEASAPELAGFLSTAMKSAGFLLLMRLVALSPHGPLALWLPAIGALTMLFGSFLALRQWCLQRLLAYSSISHAGYLILGVGAWAAQGAKPAAAAPVFFYLAAYLLMSNGAFLFLKVSGISTRGELSGYARCQPVLAALFAALLLALGGIPPTAGFLAKLFIFWEAIKAGLYVPAAAGALAALVALGYYLGLIRAMYLDDPTGAAPAVLNRGALVYLCAIPAAVLGVFPWLLSAISRVLAL